MRKQTILVLAGGLLMFAACKEETTETTGFTQEYVDSAVNARIMELQVQMEASNDSIINALATWKADSMIAAAKGQKPTTPRPKVKTPGSSSTTTTPPPPPPPPPTVGNGKPSMRDKEPGTVGNGKPSMRNNKSDSTVGNGKPKMR